jgi:hypothetical protein
VLGELWRVRRSPSTVLGAKADRFESYLRSHLPDTPVCPHLVATKGFHEKRAEARSAKAVRVLPEEPIPSTTYGDSTSEQLHRLSIQCEPGAPFSASSSFGVSSRVPPTGAQTLTPGHA